MIITPEILAKRFHELYEEFAPQFGYETREESRTTWENVPVQNRQLMVAVCDRIIEEYIAPLKQSHHTTSGKSISDIALGD